MNIYFICVFGDFNDSESSNLQITQIITQKIINAKAHDTN